MSNDPQIPVIGKETMSTQRDERKGGGVGLLAKLGLGGGASSGGAGGLAGGGGLLAGKAGVVALVLAGSSVAAGVGLLTLGGGNSNAPKVGGAMFARADGEAAPADSAEAATERAAASANAGGDGVSSSLDKFNSVNKGAVVDPYAPAKQEDVKDAAAPAETAPGAQPDHTTAQSPGTTPPAATASAVHPKMVKSQGFGSGGASGGSGASGGGPVTARAPGGAGTANFARDAAGASSAMRGGGLRGAAGAHRSAIMRGGGGATGQLRAHSSALRSNLGSGLVSSQGSGAVMDGAAPAGSIGGAGGRIAGGGAGTGGKGIDSSPGASVSKNLKDVEPPPSPEKNAKNKTPYQKEMMIAMGCIMGAMALLFISGMLSDSAKTAATPWEKLAYTNYAKYAAMAATALAAVATGIGVMVMQSQGQMMQGAMLAMVGGIMTFQAGKAWIQGNTAAKEAEAATTKAANDAAAQAGTKLSGFQATGVNSSGMASYANPTTGQTATMQLQANPALTPAQTAVPTEPPPWVGKGDPTIVTPKGG